MASGLAFKSPLTLLPLTVSLIASGLIINVVQFALFLCVRPFNTRAYRQLFYYTTYWIHSQFVCLAEWWGGLDIVCYTETENWEYFGKEHALCVLNHRYDIDWVTTFALCDRIKMLGFCRAFAKKSIKNIPVIGWSLSMGGDVFLDRNWEKDKMVIGRQVANLVEFPSAMWLMVAAEGTRFTETKHEASQKFAREKGLPELTHHLTPRTKGFTHTVPHIRGKIDAVYDIQLNFQQGVEPTIMGLMNGEKYEAHIYINRIRVDSLPEGEEELSTWMHRLYQKKDKMVDSFFKTGDFFKESGVAAVPSRRLARRTCSLLNVAFWSILTLTPITYYVFQLLMAGSLLYISIVLAVTASCGALIIIMVRMSQIGKGSSYGGSHTKNKTK